MRRKQTTLQQATGEATPPPLRSHSIFTRRRFNTRKEIEKIRANEKEIMLRWERDEEGWRDLPARAWPAYQPNPEQLKVIERKISDMAGCDLFKSSSTKNNKPDDLCSELQFQAATALVFYNMDPAKGFQQYRLLAQRGHVDSMVACGIVLVEGMGIPADEAQGIEWLQKATKLNSAQAWYELGCLYYTGIDGVLEEDPARAFECFQVAAQQDHTAGLYMVADCLLEGEGTERDVGRAVPLFYRAAERGHRFSRQRVRELLATYSTRPL